MLILVYCVFPFIIMTKQPLTYGHSYEHQSKILKESRRYMVSLPESYHSTHHTYPTLYVIDSDFQFHHVANITRHLARMGKISPMIVVGIANQGPRDYLLSNTWPIEDSTEFGDIEIFSLYLKNELIPIIEQQFKTNTKRAIAGYSLGGLFVMYSYIDKASPFNVYLAMSPSVWYDDYTFKDKLENYFSQPLEKQPPLFISLANEKGIFC